MYLCAHAVNHRVRAREQMRAYHEEQARKKREAEVDTITSTIALTPPAPQLGAATEPTRMPSIPYYIFASTSHWLAKVSKSN